MAIGGMDVDISKKLQRYTDYSMGKSSEKIDIKYVDASFKEFVFTGYDLNNTEFLEVLFDQCDFTDVYLSGSNLSGSIFNHCILNNNIFRKGKADYVSLIQTNIKSMDSFRTSFYGTSFKDMCIEGTMMCNCFIVNAFFSNVVFRNVNLTNTNFKNSTFDNVKFIGCILVKTIFDDVCGLEYAKFIDNKG